MNLTVVAALSGRLLTLVALLMLLPAGLAAWDGARQALAAFLGSFALTLATSIGLLWAGRGAPVEVHRKDAFGAVGFIWVALGCFGALPFLFEGSIVSTTSAVFEAVSGFTTTGATVIADVDGLSRATNLWRCLSHWVGGMGIVVLFVAVFPQLGVGAKHLFKTEVPGPITEGLRPRIKHTALWLWWIYAGLTACTRAALVVGRSFLVRRDLPCVFDAGHRWLLDARGERGRVRKPDGGLDPDRLHVDRGAQLRAVLRRVARPGSRLAPELRAVVLLWRQRALDHARILVHARPA